MDKINTGTFIFGGIIIVGVLFSLFFGKNEKVKEFFKKSNPIAKKILLVILVIALIIIISPFFIILWGVLSGGPGTSW